MQFDYDSGDPVTHSQTRIYVAGLIHSIEVDTQLAPLIETLWQQGYRTVASCQNQHDRGRAWIGFENKAQAARFQVATRHLGSTIVRKYARDFVGVPPDDPFRHGATAVSFPSLLIEPITRQFAA